MSKEYLEAFNRIEQEVDGCMYIYHIEENDINIVKKSLLELQAIKEANPSEALRCLNKLDNSNYFFSKPTPEDKVNEIANCFKIVKQALLKAQEQEEDIIHYKGTIANLRRDNALLKELNAEYKKVLEIIFEKNVDILALKIYDNVEDYNENLIWDSQKDLTQEEFELLKRWFNREDKSE